MSPNFFKKNPPTSSSQDAGHHLLRELGTQLNKVNMLMAVKPTEPGQQAALAINNLINFVSNVLNESPVKTSESRSSDTPEKPSQTSSQGPNFS